jgi:peptidoglycan/LPS O-acetylase OafA/YrhL
VDDSDKQAGPPRLPYLPALDGLRGIAVLLVVIYHCDWIPGGYIGVDVFFALSGYLITSLLYQEYQTAGKINFRSFYLRRALRLLPALIGVMLACLLFRHRYHLTTLFSNAGLLAALFYVGNWVMAYQAGHLGAIGHTWSLAIEEQYYLLWPPALQFGLRRFSLPKLRTGITVLYFLSLSACLWIGLYSTESRVYFASDTRAHAILLGSLLSLDDRRWPAWIGLIGAQGLGAISLFSHRHDASLLPALFLAPIFGAMLLAALTTRSESKNLLQTMFSVRPLVAVGKVSYGLYLWHLPLLVVYRDHFGNVRTVALAVVCALASYYLIERPFLRLKKRIS